MNVVYALTRSVYPWLMPSIRSRVKHNPTARAFIVCEDDELPFDRPIRARVINISNQKLFPRIGEHRTEAFGGYTNHLKAYYTNM